MDPDAYHRLPAARCHQESASARGRRTEATHGSQEGEALEQRCVESAASVGAQTALRDGRMSGISGTANLAAPPAVS